MNKKRRMASKDYRTEQEAFWAGAFGNAYIKRNRGGNILASNVALFARILGRTIGVNSVIEMGANIGLNLKAIRLLCPEVSLTGVEINVKAFREMKRIRGVKAIQASLLDYEASASDFAFTKGVLIHLNPDELPLAYDRLAAAGRRYVAIIEYYNPTPMDVTYRGHNGRLYKRDFAGEFMDRQKSFRLVDYAFVYHSDPVFPQGDLTWFLMERMAT